MHSDKSTQTAHQGTLPVGAWHRHPVHRDHRSCAAPFTRPPPQRRQLTGRECSPRPDIDAGQPNDAALRCEEGNIRSPHGADMFARFRIEELDDLVGCHPRRTRTPPVGHAQHSSRRKSRPARGNELARTLARTAIPPNLLSRPVKTQDRLPKGVDHVQRAVRAKKHDHRIPDTGLSGLLQDNAVQQAPPRPGPRYLPTQ